MEKDDIEKKVAESLELIAGKGIREFYEDAKTILNSNNLNAPEKAIGHYLREVESALFAIAVNTAQNSIADVSQYGSNSYYPQTGDEAKETSRKEKIDLLIRHFNLNLDQSQIEFWKNMELNKLAHRRGLKTNRRISDNFIEDMWMPYSKVLLEFAECINKLFLEYYVELESLAKNPSKASVKILLEKIPNNPHLRDHFFSKIEDFSAWLPILKGKGVFKDVPSEYQNDEGYRIIQPWPPLHFLLRIAAETQDEGILECVAEIASEIPETENLRVNDDFLILAGKLPAKLAAKYLMGRIRLALDAQGLYSMGEKVSGLLEQLYRDGFREELLELSERVISDEKLNVFFKERYGRNSIDFYDYSGLLTILCGFNDIDIFKLLLNRTLEGLALSFEDQNICEFVTMRWKDAFDDEAEKEEFSLMYISKLSLSIKSLIDTGKASTMEVVEILREGNKGCDWHILDALILHLLENAEDEVDETLKLKLQENLSDFESQRRNAEEPRVWWVAHHSPLSDEQMLALSAQETLEQLRLYDGPIENTFNDGPSRTGLLKGVERQIKERPHAFVACLEEFKSLPNDDYAALIYSFGQAEFEADKKFENQYLSLVKEFVENRYDNTSAENRRCFSQGLVSVFRKIFNAPERYLRMNGVAFKALNKIIHDQSVESSILSSAEEGRFNELAIHAINTPFIEAFDCLIRCYIAPNTKSRDIHARKDIDDFKSYVLDVIKANESAPFRFSVGKQVKFLYEIDNEWFLEELTNILLNKDNNDLWEAFVAGMMAQNIICNDILDQVYRDAISYVSTEDYLSNHQEQDDFSIEKGIARHISFYYCQLDTKDCTENSLTNYIFTHGSLQLRESFLIESIRELERGAADSKRVFKRLRALIDWRHEELRKINFIPDTLLELSVFFELFPIAVKFDPQWSLERLHEFMDLLETNGEPFYPDLIIDSLIEQAEAFPLLTTKCLLSWVKNMGDRWYDFHSVEKLIKSLHQHGNNQIDEVLKEIVSRLSSKGFCKNPVTLFENA